MRPVYVVDVIRTAIGKYGGGLSSIRPDDLLAHTIKALIQRNPSIDLHAIEDVIPFQLSTPAFDDTHGRNIGVGDCVTL